MTHIEDKPAAAGYKNRFDLNERLEELHQQDVEYIIHEVCAKDRDNQFRRKLVVIDVRERSQDEQDATSRDKAATYFQKIGVYLDGASVICSSGAAIAGQSVAGGLFHVVAEAFSKTSGYKEKISSSQIEIYTHRYQRIGGNISEQSQQIQSAERDSAQMAAKIDQLMQSAQRQWEIAASSNS